MEEYLTGARRQRVKEWFPDLAGLSRLSKVEVIEDIDTINERAGPVPPGSGLPGDPEASPHKRRLGQQHEQNLSMQGPTKRARLLAKLEDREHERMGVHAQA